MRSRSGVVGSVLTAGVLLFGAVEAAQARGVFRRANCPEQGNWCAISLGELQNCNDCCSTPEGGSFCAFFEEDGTTLPLPQGCVCG